MTIQITIIIVAVCAAVIAVSVTAKRVSDRNTEARKDTEYLDILRERDRMQADAERDARAASFYALKIAMDTVQAQAAAQAKISGYTAQALANAVDGLKADRKTLEALETRAVVDAYTKMIQNQKKEAKRIAKKEDKEKGTPKQDRYWEGVDYYV